MSILDPSGAIDLYVLNSKRTLITKCKVPREIIQKIKAIDKLNKNKYKIDNMKNDDQIRALSRSLLWQLFGDSCTYLGFPNRRRILQEATFTSGASSTEISPLSFSSVTVALWWCFRLILFFIFRSNHLRRLLSRRLVDLSSASLLLFPCFSCNQFVPLGLS